MCGIIGVLLGTDGPSAGLADTIVRAADRAQSLLSAARRIQVPGAVTMKVASIFGISSGFSKRRWHPVLKRWRAHKGVDYAAPTGTPVMATGDGTVSFANWKKGNGRVIYQDGRNCHYSASAQTLKSSSTHRAAPENDIRGPRHATPQS